MTGLLFDWPNLRQPGVTTDTISVQEQSTGFRYRSAASGYGNKYSSQINYKFATSYITGSHAFKTGIFVQQGWRRHVNEVNGNMNYRFNNGVPNRVTLWATPIVLNENLKANLGLFGQDQWGIRRLTLNLGLRFDYFNSYVPEQHLPAGQFVPARDFAPCPAPDAGKICRHGLPPRTICLATARRPSSSTSGSSWRRTSWTRRAGSTQSRRRCRAPTGTGPMRILTSFPRRRARPAVRRQLRQGERHHQVHDRRPERIRQPDARLAAFRKRSASARHGSRCECRLFQNELAELHDNRQPAGDAFGLRSLFDHSALNPRLPGGGGYAITGLYSVSTRKFGQNDSLVSFSSQFGDQTDIYNGVDVNFNARLPRSAFVQGGLSSGRQATNACFVVDSPQALRFCEVTPPLQTQVKLIGGYTLRAGIPAVEPSRASRAFPLRRLIRPPTVRLHRRSIATSPLARTARRPSSSFNPARCSKAAFSRST